MKKTIFISVGLFAASICNVHALCYDWGDANNFSDIGAQVIAKCTPEGWIGGTNCATLDYELTFVTKDTDGSCRYVPSCATCPDGYRLDSEPIEYKIGEVCFIGDDNNVSGYTQSMLDVFPVEYYTCEKIPTSCASGYYGKTTNGTTGCTQCPTATNIYTNSARTTLARGTSTYGDNEYISGCFIAQGTYYDATGTFKLSPCYYKN